MQEMRYNWIDWAKAFSIYAVILGHVVTQDNSKWIIYCTVIMVSFHVPLFFLVSGYLWHIKEGSFKKYILNSAKSLLVPYMFFNLVSAPILYRLQAQDVWQKGLVEFFLGESHSFAGPTWFLIALIIIRIAAYGLTRFSSRLRWCLVLSIGVLPALVNIPSLFSINSACLGLMFFEFGSELRRNNAIELYNRLPCLLKIILPISLLIIMLTPVMMNTGIDFSACRFEGNVIIAYLRTFVAVAMVLSFCLLCNNVSFSFIKEVSIDCIVIMGLHMTFVQIFWAYGEKLPYFTHLLFESPLNSISSMLLSLGAAIILKKYCPQLVGNRR